MHTLIDILSSYEIHVYSLMKKNFVSIKLFLLQTQKSPMMFVNVNKPSAFGEFCPDIL